MKEHGLLLSAPMVRALGAGQKTQTRRGITLHNSVIERFEGWTKAQVWEMLDFSRAKVNMQGQLYVPFKAGVTTLKMAIEVKPRVQAGDVIWWKETWTPAESDGGPVISYRAGGTMMHCAKGDKRNGTWEEFVVPGHAGTVYDFDQWRPSIFMPRWAARYTSDVIGAWPERLQEISWDDAVAEGCPGYRPTQDEPTQQYQRLWNEINGPGSWEANPLVWVYEFTRP